MKPHTKDNLSGFDQEFIRTYLGESRQLTQIFFVQLFTSVRNGIMITDSNARILAVNPAFTKITGYSAEDVLGETPKILHSGHHDNEFYRSMWKEINIHDYWQGEIWNRKKSGEIYPELLTVNRVVHPHTNEVFYVGIFSDISHTKHSHL